MSASLALVVAALTVVVCVGCWLLDRAAGRRATAAPPSAFAGDGGLRRRLRRRAGAQRGDTARAVRLLNRFTRRQRKTFVMALGMLVLEAGAAVFEAAPLAYLVDFLTDERGPLPLPWLDRADTGSDLLGPASISTIAVLTAAIVLVAMVNSAADSMAEIYLARGGRTLGFNLRTTLFGHLQRLSLAFHDRRRTGDVITRVTGDVTELEDFVVDSVSDIAGSFLLLAGTIAFLLFNSWEVTVVAVAIIPVLAFVSNHFSKRIKAAAKRQRAREGDLASTTQEMLTSIRVVQTFGRGGEGEKRFAHQSGKAMDAAIEASRLEAWFSWVVSVLEALTIAGVVWIGLWLLGRDGTTPGLLVMFVYLVDKMFKPTRKIIKEWNKIGKLYASVERIAEVLERESTVKDEPGAVPAPALSGRVEFRGVSFDYQVEPEEAEQVTVGPQRRRALRDVSFSVAPGEVVALVGHSGAGKTTIAQLLPRLYDPQQGRVLLDGHDVRGFTLESLRSQISVVLQETILFSGTVAENIAYGRADASHDEIVAAAVQANAHEFIEEMPEGYATELSERAANLSGGQRQRIAIARALIRGAPLLILDEPTTGLDAESTEVVLRALRTLMRGKTTLLISHDLNLIRSADRIIVLRAGEIDQIGSHEELLEKGGLYAQLYARQFSEVETASEDLEPATAGPARSPDGHRGRGGIEPPGSSPLDRELPHLPVALDGDEMRARLQDASLGASERELVVRECVPAKVLYVPGECCLIRYRLRIEDVGNGLTWPSIVSARLFGDEYAGTAFLEERLAPLAAQARGRSETTPFSSPVAMVRPLPLVAHVFPIDPELPSLIGATEHGRMLDVLRSALPEASDGSLVVDDCRIELAHYPRRGHCLLRYDLEGRLTRSDEAVRRTVYGKVSANPRPSTASVLTTLRARVLDDGSPYRFLVPRVIGSRPDLDLLLMEAIPGTSAIPALVRGRAGAGDGGASVALEQAVESCARIAASLHASGVDVDVARTLENDIGALESEIAALRRASPQLGARLHEWLDRLRALGSASASLAPRPSHGDYTHGQVLFDDTVSGLVDFDNMCRAEAALDLGHFCAYLRVACRKAERAAAGATAARADELCAVFLGAYLEASPAPIEDADHLRERTMLYEAVTLARIVSHSWHQLKDARTANALSVLEERMECLPTLRR